MTSTVYYGSPRQTYLTAKETLPAKLDLILEALHLRDRVKDENVCLKLHVGNDIGYSTIHPVFVRKVVQAIKDMTGGYGAHACILGAASQKAFDQALACI